MDKWLNKMENSNTSSDSRCGSQGNHELVDFIYQEISSGGNKFHPGSISPVKEHVGFPLKKNQNTVLTSGISSASMSDSGILTDKDLMGGGNNDDSDLLRCFAIVYERKGAYVLMHFVL